MMDRQEFYDRLMLLGRKFRWGVDNKRIHATMRGTRYNPVTALAQHMGHGTFQDNKKSTLKAGTALGLPRNFTNDLYDATVGSSNRGNTQVVRGHLRGTLGV
jgi:hypothetical protein